MDRDDHVLARPQPRIVTGNGNAVAHRRHQRDPLWRSIDQPGEQATQLVCFVKKISRDKLGRIDLAPQPGNAGRLDRFQQRRHVRAVEVVLVLGQGEEMALAFHSGVRPV